MCSAYEACLGKANGDWQERSQCAIDYQVSGSSEVSPLSACLASKCTNECGLTCGGLAAEFTTPDMADMCQQCVAGGASCAAEQACASLADCDALVRCRLACNTLDCSGACVNAHDAGADGLASLLPIFRGDCSDLCAFGKNWSCVGKVSWPARKADTTTFTVDVQDFVNTQKFLSGVDLLACNGNDVDCTDFLAKGQTNDAGRAVFEVPNQAQVSGLGLNGYLQLTLPGYVPDLSYWGFPLSEATFTESYNAFLSDGLRLVTPADLQALATSLNMTLDPQLGIVAILVADCGIHVAPGVTVTTNVAGLSPIYNQNSSLMATDTTGFLAFLNVPPGTVDFTAFPVALGGKASSHVSVIVRAGSITTVAMEPTP